MRFIKSTSRNFLTLLFISYFISSTTFGSDLKPGTLLLLGDVLRYNQKSVWKQIFKHAGGEQADIVVIAAAHKRAKLYGKFAVRALSRYGPFVELLPLSVSPDDFNNNYHKVIHDPKIIEQVREADGIFFVGGSPQRLTKILFDNNHSLTPLAKAVRNVYSTGGLIVGGIPGQIGVNTDSNALLALQQGKIAQDDLYQGLDLIPEGWFVDQHFFSTGRFAKTLVAMLQTGKKHGISINTDSFVIFKDNQFEVYGESGAVIIDLSNVKISKLSDKGLDIKAVRLSYLTDGDRFDLDTSQITIQRDTLEGFEINPNTDDHQPLLDNLTTTAVNLLAQHGLVELMSIALDSEEKQTIRFAFDKEAEKSNMGFKFRFYTGEDTRGWLTTRFKTDKYITLNILLDINPITLSEVTKSVQ